MFESATSWYRLKPCKVYKFDSEGQRSLLGEIVEMPRVSWEVDLLKILTK